MSKDSKQRAQQGKVAPANDADAASPDPPVMNQRSDSDQLGKKKKWWRRSKSGKHTTGGKHGKDGEKPKTIEDQDFSWSAHLWQEAADSTFNLALVLFLTFTIGGAVGFKYIEDWSWVDSVYFVFATLTTVGYGDVSPTTALGRDIGICFIVLGVTTLGFVFSFLLQYSAAHSADASLEFQKKLENLEKDMHVNELKKLMEDKRHKLKYKALTLCLKLAAMVFVFVGVFCGCFSWPFRDTVYFIVVTSTTVGYGDVLPLTDAEKIVTIFTMIISTVLMGQILSGAVDLYVVDILEEQIKKKIIASATYVHMCDLEGDGQINEAEYTIFKLLQLQKVDREFLIPIAERFRELDADGSGKLDVGVEVPAPYGWKKDQKKTKSLLGVDSRERVRVGSKVEARHDGGSRFYPGVVVFAHNESDNPTFDILYEDGDKEEHVDLLHIYEPPDPAELREGQAVEARHDGGHTFYPGVIAKSNDDGTFAVDYDDGDFEERVVLRHIFAVPFSEGGEQDGESEAGDEPPTSPSSAEDLSLKFEVERLRSMVDDLQAQLDKAHDENARYKRIEYITNVCRVDPLTNIPLNSPFKPVAVRRSPVSPLNLSDRGKAFFDDKDEKGRDEGGAISFAKEVEMQDAPARVAAEAGADQEDDDEAEIQRKQSKRERKEKRKLKKEKSRKG